MRGYIIPKRSRLRIAPILPAAATILLFAALKEE